LRSFGRAVTMSGELLLCGALAAGLLIYLIAALLNPEDFS